MMTRILFSILMGLALLVLCSCKSMKIGADMQKNELMSRHWRSYDGKVMPWTSGEKVKEEPAKAVVITIHGLNGAASDFWQLSRDWPGFGVAMYGLELRGQGNDPVVVERGDIAKASVWMRDLKVFHQLVKEKHPKTPIFWYAESMGSLIAIHTLARRTWRARDLPDGLIISAPPAGLRQAPTGIKKAFLQSLIKVLPWKKVNLEKLGSSTMNEIKVTQDATLKSQSQLTPHYVPRQTLRLLGEVDWMIRQLPRSVDHIRMPTLILASPNDAVASERQIQHLFDEISSKDKTLLWYRKSYHLLLHDVQRDEVYHDVTQWVQQHMGIEEKPKSSGFFKAKKSQKRKVSATKPR